MKRRVRSLFPIVFMFVAGATIVDYSPSVEAHHASVKPGKSDALRAIYATALEVAEGKRIAEAACVRCHGLNGISTVKGVPHLAGQRPAYLYLELRAYQSGARGKKTMDGAVEFLSDDALVRVAAYYASLDPAQPVATSGAKSRAGQPDPVQAGKAARPAARVATARAASARRPACRASSRWTRNTLSRQ